MSIPLDRLYHFVDSLCGGDIVIYRFFPHGSKKITDLNPLKPLDLIKNVMMLCNDQEPLDFDYYSDIQRLQELQQKNPEFLLNYVEHPSPELVDFLSKKNLKMVDNQCLFNPKILLLHSERLGYNLTKYQQSGFTTVYWWSHALLARDWFRYAKHDPDLQQTKIEKDFLIYNRAWSGSREYRLKFSELVVKNNLADRCIMTFNCKDNGQHYTNHLYRNPQFAVNTVLQNYFSTNTYDAQASADYVSGDYVNTGIEVVLETLFDDDRWHLTEKALRPLACGQPFLLAATAGSLQYLRSYGFNTFSSLIDETYDTITDPVARLQAIVQEMQRISDLPHNQKIKLFKDLRIISVANQLRFFSDDFYQQVVSELQNNLARARDQLLGI